MKRTPLLLGLSGLAAILLVSAHSIVSSAGAAPTPQPEMDPDQMAMMQAWMEAGTPGAHHKHLEKMAGRWDAEVTMWPAPGAPEQRSTGRSSNAMIMDGRFLRSDYTGEMMGMPFTGVSLWGYNNVTGEYESVWIDSMSTGMFVSTGSCDAEGRTFTMNGSYKDAFTGQMRNSRFVTRIENEDKHVFEMYEVDGQEQWMTMRITYTRRD